MVNILREAMVHSKDATKSVLGRWGGRQLNKAKNRMESCNFHQTKCDRTKAIDKTLRSPWRGVRGLPVMLTNWGTPPRPPSPPFTPLPRPPRPPVKRLSNSTTFPYFLQSQTRKDWKRLSRLRASQSNSKYIRTNMKTGGAALGLMRSARRTNFTRIRVYVWENARWEA